MFNLVIAQHKKSIYAYTKVSFILLILILQACSATKHVLDEEQTLLVGNNIILNTTKKEFADKAEIQSQLAKQVIYSQQPNKKFLSMFRLKLGLYAMSYKKTKNILEKDSTLLNNNPEEFYKKYPKLRRKKNKNAAYLEDFSGEPPVIFDSLALKASEQKMTNYLFYKGYFDNQVHSTYSTKKKKTTAIYTVDTKVEYRYRNIYFIAEDSILDKIVSKNIKESYLKSSDIFDIDNIKNERERIANIIQNEGYFTFSPDFIILKVDSTMGNHQIDAYLTIKNDIDSSLHKKYVYLDVNLNINYDNKISSKKVNLTERTKDTICNVNYNVAKNSIIPRILSKSLRLKPNDVYTVREQLATRSNLYGLGVFKYVNIKHEPFSFSPEEMGLITTIECVPSKRHSFSNQLELNTNAQSTLGFSVSASYINKNVFNTAAKLYVSVRSGLDFQIQKRFEDSLRLSAINNVNVSAEAKITLARIAPSFKKKTCDSYEKYKPKTNMALNYNFQKRILLYSLHAININYGYEWYNDKFRHTLSPLSFTYVRPNNITAEFQSRLDTNTILRRSFDNQFILGQDYSFFYTNQNINIGKYKNHFSFRTNLSLAGNIIYGFSSISKNKEKPYTLSKIPYAQFIKMELEPKYFFNFKKKQSLGLRMFVGIGIPYGNSSFNGSAIMPYIRQFSAGGPNSLRAWLFRQVGPGSTPNRFSSLSTLDQTGDIKLEWNAEYRFNIYKLFKGAIFTDAGNIWLYKKNAESPGAEFNFKRFGKEIAWDAGLGIRLDLSFFIIRFDVALPIYDPGYDQITDGIKWLPDIIKQRKEIYNYYKIDNPDTSKKYMRKNVYGRLVGLNIAIGYPF
jgi:outer membrane protein insertion porin family